MALAHAADVSPRHVSLVEIGRSTPSADMIIRLAEQLHVPLRDRNRLLLAAGFAPRYRERPLDDEALSTITTFGTPQDITLDEIAVESYYPADAHSAAFFTDSAPPGDLTPS